MKRLRNKTKETWNYRVTGALDGLSMRVIYVGTEQLIIEQRGGLKRCKYSWYPWQDSNLQPAA